MEWIKVILEKHKNEEGTIDVEQAIKDINKEFPNNAVPKDTYNDLAKTKKQLETDIHDRDYQIAEFEKIDVAALEKEIETHKLDKLKTNIAIQAKIPLELAGRLSGETEEEIKADAENMAGFVNKKQPLPLKHTEPQQVDKTEQAYENIIDNLK